MRLRLTDLAIRKLALPSSGQRTYWDATTPGFGVRCSARSKSYVVMYGSRRRLKTLGRHPDLALSDARKRAKLQLAHHSSRSDEIGSFDYQSVLAEYLEDCKLRLRQTTTDGYARYLNAIRFTGPVDRVTRQDVMRGIRKYTNSPSSQNFAFITFKVFFNWLIKLQYLERNPLEGIGRPHAPSSRDRVLSRDEASALLRYTLGNRDRFNDIVSLLLMTGQRRGEIAGLRWEEIDGTRLKFASDRTKNKHAHEIPMPQSATDLIHSIDGGSTYVFGTSETDTPFSGWSRAHRRLLQVTELARFTLHDLRRTFATFHAEIGTPIHVTERLLNHRSGTISGVAAVYNRHSYLSEMADAVARYNELLAKLGETS